MSVKQIRDLLGGPPGDLARTLGYLLLLVVATLIALWVTERFFDRLVGALLDRETSEGTAQELSAIEVKKRRDTLRGLITATARALILVIAFVTGLNIVGLEIGPTIAGLGIVGVALGIGAQGLVRDYVSGTFILIENQYAKGDVVKIADVSGTVEDFTLRRTTLRDLDGTVHTVPNGLIGVSSNLTRVWARINLDVTVAYGNDIDRVIAVVDETGRELADDPVWKRRVLEAPRVERVEALAEYGITIKILGSVRAADRWAGSGELRKRVLEAFAKHGIEIPRPQRLIVGAPPAPSESGTADADDLPAGED